MGDWPYPAIWYIRHGETDWNRAGRIQGRTDITLNKTGRRQAVAAAQTLRCLLPDPRGHALFASPLSRTRQTAAAVLDIYGLGESAVTWDDRLTELSFGAVEGMLWLELNALGIQPEVNPDAYHDWRPKGGESYADAHGRVLEWLEALTGPAIVIGHGGISRVLRGIMFRLPKSEIVQLKVPQKRFFRIEDGTIEWFG